MTGYSFIGFEFSNTDFTDTCMQLHMQTLLGITVMPLNEIILNESFLGFKIETKNYEKC